MPTEWTHPPEADEIEVTLLGRGFGESVIVHLGDGEWAVIDSLLDKKRHSAPKAYLEKFGVPPDRVRAIIATHWHDDHVAGISQLYEWATGAKLVMPFVKTSKELTTYIEGQQSSAVGDVSSGISELAAISRHRRAQRRPVPIHCQADLTILRKFSAGLGCEVVLHALSPLPSDLDAFLVRLGQGGTPSELAKRLMPFEPNDISVAAWLSIGEEAVLLGADLEVVADEKRGWRAVVASDVRPAGRASLFKIPHHGSENGDYDKVWTDMLHPDPVSMLSPFSKGTGLPTDSQVKKIVARSPVSFATNVTPFRKYKDAKDIARAALEASKLGMRAGHSEMGSVTARRRPNHEPEWRTNFSGGASLLKNFVARS